MIHYHYFITHKPSLSLDEFYRYWHDRHPLAGGRTEQTRRYIQSHRVPAPKGDAMFDGAAEVWWDDEAAMIEAGRTTGRKFRADGAELYRPDPGRVAGHQRYGDQGAAADRGVGVKGIFIVKRRMASRLRIFASNGARRMDR